MNGNNKIRSVRPVTDVEKAMLALGAIPTKCINKGCVCSGQVRVRTKTGSQPICAECAASLIRSGIKEPEDFIGLILVETEEYKGHAIPVPTPDWSDSFYASVNRI